MSLTVQQALELVGKGNNAGTQRRAHRSSPEGCVRPPAAARAETTGQAVWRA